MTNYQKMYYLLFNAMSEATQILLTAIQQEEEFYLTEEDTVVTLHEKNQ